MRYLSLSLPGGYEVNSAGNAPGNISIMTIIQTAFNLIIVFSIIFCLLILIYAGIQWLISGGNKEKIKNQQQRIVFALIGLIIIFLAIFIVNFIGNFFNVGNLGNPNISP